MGWRVALCSYESYFDALKFLLNPASSVVFFVVFLAFHI